MIRLRVLQHNVVTWDRLRFDLNNTYRQFDPVILLLSSHGLTDDARIKVLGCRVHQRNASSEPSDRVAIAVRCRLYCRVEDSFLSETLAVAVDTFDNSPGGRHVLSPALTTFSPSPRLPQAPPQTHSGAPGGSPECLSQ